MCCPIQLAYRIMKYTISVSVSFLVFPSSFCSTSSQLGDVFYGIPAKFKQEKWHACFCLSLKLNSYSSVVFVIGSCKCLYSAKSNVTQKFLLFRIMSLEFVNRPVDINSHAHFCGGRKRISSLVE